MTIIDPPARPDPALDDPGPDGPWWRHLTLGRALAGLFLISMAVFWVWAFSPWKPDSDVDRLTSDDFGELARPRCQTMLDELADLPNPADVTTPAERADLLVLQNAVVAQLVVDLRVLPLGSADDAFLLESWFADWDQYLADRDRHVDRLRTAQDGDDLRFRLTALNGGRGVDARIDGFATINRMVVCSTPGDV